jgi:ATP-binding cassette subfamily B protein
MPNRPSVRALVAPGDHIELDGSLGSRKTLLLALLQQQYDPAAGRVLIDGIDVAVLSRDSLSAPISVVSKDVQLFHCSVMENIRYGREDGTDDEVWDAALAAFTNDFIKALPQGYDTPGEERGIRLSGGQRQRLAIARAFLREPPILLLDEATSALNSECEVCVHEALDQLAHGRTVIAVAHRLSTLREFDRIMEMENGCVADEGPLEQLARRPEPIWICFGTKHNQCQRSRFERI